MSDALDTPLTLAATSIQGLGTPYHVGVATRNIEEAMSSIGGMFSLEWAPVKVGAEPGLATPSGPVPWSTRVVHCRRGPMRFELLEGSKGSVWETAAVAELHHFAYWSDDVTRDVALMEADGWQIEVTFYDPQGVPNSFAYMRKADAPRVELVDASRRPAWLEFISS